MFLPKRAMGRDGNIFEYVISITCCLQVDISFGVLEILKIPVLLHLGNCLVSGGRDGMSILWHFRNDARCWKEILNVILPGKM